MLYIVKITNIYEDGDEVVVFERFDAPKMPWWTDDQDGHDAWWDEHVQPLTGTGRTQGDAGYFAEIVRFAGADYTVETEDVEAIGCECEWGT